jgi:hypothetical protein
MKYTVILFKNKERKKLLKSFKTFERADAFFTRLQEESRGVVFNKEIENGISCDFEIGLIDNTPTEFENYFVRDDLGRQVRIKTDDSTIKIVKISKYRLEELIYDISKNKRLSFKNFYKSYLSGSEIKIISKLNNKFFIQEDDNINLFSLKTESDCLRFFSQLETYLFEKKKANCILVSDSSTRQKKYLYSLLESKGISKKSLYKQSTTFFKEYNV